MKDLERGPELIGRDALLWGAGSFMALRVIASGAAAYSLRFLTAGSHIQVPGYEPPVITGAWRWLASPWLRSDALWYLRTSEQGYGVDLQSYAFYPAFPLLTRLLSLVVSNELYAALLVASLSSILGLVLMYSLFDRLAGRDAAQAGTIGFALFPTSFFLVAPYAESLLVALGCGALLMALAGKAFPASMLGVAAAMTRPFGILLAIPLFVLSRRPESRSRWLVGGSPIIGALMWFVYAAGQTGDPLAAVRVQGLWQREFAFFPSTIVSAIVEWIRWMPSDIGPYFLADVVAFFFSVALIAGGFTWLRRAGLISNAVAVGFGIYGGVLMLLVLSSPFPPRPLLSLPRFVLALFPLFVAYGWFSKNRVLRGIRWPALALSAAGLGIGTAVFVAGRSLF